MKSAVTAAFVVVSVALTSAAPQAVEDRAARGGAAAQYEIARRYLAEGKTFDALPLLMQASLKDYAPAEFQIGLISLTGAGGFPRDYKMAAGWFELASNHGDLKARAMLGKMHIYTKFGMVDHALAARLLEEPAKQGDPESQFLLAGMYVEQNKDSEGIGWLMRAARQGVAEAQAMVSGLALDARDAGASYVWATLALTAKETQMTEKDLADLRKLRDVAAGRMTDGQLSEAARRAREWRPVRECADCATFLMVRPPA